MMAVQHNFAGITKEFQVRWNFSHRNQYRAFDPRRFILPFFAHIHEKKILVLRKEFPHFSRRDLDICRRLFAHQ
jgi:hypothetical protein